MGDSTTAQDPSRVSFGYASGAGYGVTVAGAIAAVLSYLTGKHSQAQIGPIVGAAVALVSLLVTQIGRYVQANTQIRAEAQKALHSATTVVHTLEEYDPDVLTRVAAIVREAIRDEAGRSLEPRAPAQIAAAVRQTIEEEAAKLRATAGELADRLKPPPASGAPGSDDPLGRPSASDSRVPADDVEEPTTPSHGAARGDALLPSATEEAASQPPG